MEGDTKFKSKSDLNKRNSKGASSRAATGIQGWGAEKLSLNRVEISEALTDVR